MTAWGSSSATFTSTDGVCGSVLSGPVKVHPAATARISSAAAIGTPAVLGFWAISRILSSRPRLPPVMVVAVSSTVRRF